MRKLIFKAGEYHFTRLTFLILTTLFLASCGFHLRGMLDMPPWLNDISLMVPTSARDLEVRLKEQLEAYHIRICHDPVNAKYWLVIEQENVQQHITSVSSSTTPRQYQLIYNVRFKLQQAKGKELISSTTLVVTRQLTVNSNRILGSNDEEAKLKSEMRRDAAIQIIDRMGRARP